jgi:hypothetical protein
MKRLFKQSWLLVKFSFIWRQHHCQEQRNSLGIRKFMFFEQGGIFIVAPVRIRVRIDPPPPLVCRKRRLNGAFLRMGPEKPRPRVTVGVTR